MRWRIYRLPGSREWWTIDSGRGTQVVFVTSWDALGSTTSVSDDSGVQPRAWIETCCSHLYIKDDHAMFHPEQLELEQVKK